MEDVTEALQLVKHDPFELEFTIRWLTGFIARSSSWTSPSSGLLSDKELDEREALVEKAASLLSSCAGADVEEEALTRKFQFPLGPSSDEEDICVELNDMLAPEDHSSVGLQSWASSIYFARLMCQDPSGFDIVSDKPLRILELGAGTGMLSIAAAKIHSALCGEQVEAEIVATDYHPDVLANLQRNVDTNFPSTAHPTVSIHLLDWQYPPLEMPFDKHFDVILAADVDCVERMLKRPSPACSEGGVFWMIIAIRNTGRHEGLAESVFDVFPVVSAEQETPSEHLSLKSVMVQDMERSGGVGRMDESGYRLFKICWM
ncbi:hypothetical protein DFH11DRAFT_1754099 [Phellopilus nigrolimitatus]|nr:hypothetical protein DFH11DRAFT_1754099 [Phellopilus nigrolimitatus]